MIPEKFLIDHIYFIVFLLFGIGFSVSPFIISRLIAPRKKEKKTESIYECGVDPFGSAWTRFAIVYYLYALMFIAFDVDVLYLFPVAITYGEGFLWQDLVEVVIFVFILSLAIVYAWVKGVFKWPKKISFPPLSN